MDLIEEIIDVPTDDGDMAVVVTRPADSDATPPTVAIFIDAPGIRPATLEFMARLAGNGYRVITPDLHHRHGRLLHVEPADRAADPEGVGQMMMRWITSMTDDQIQHDLDRALAACGVGDDEPFAVIGFCLGARAVVRTMDRFGARCVAGAAWHPSFLVDDAPGSPHECASSLTSPLYLGIGEADQVQSIAMHRKFLDAVEPLPHVRVETFPGADHGFTWPGYPTYDERAAETSWQATLDMLATAFSRTA